MPARLVKRASKRPARPGLGFFEDFRSALLLGVFELLARPIGEPIRAGFADDDDRRQHRGRGQRVGCGNSIGLQIVRFTHRRGARLLTITNLLRAVGVAFTLLVNLERGYPLLALGGTVLIAAILYWRWARAGRPRGIEAIEREAEAED
jgi:hypothetical protein